MQTLEAKKTFHNESLLNNDALAHVDLLLNNQIEPEYVLNRIVTEFVTDIGERIAQPFNSSFEFIVSPDGKLISSTGMDFEQFLKTGVVAAENDVNKGLQTKYHANRAKAYYNQYQEVINWLNNHSDSSGLLLLSLCPEPNELAPAEAKKQGYKPDRNLASLQLFRKGSDGNITMQAFSIDSLGLTDLADLKNSLDATGDVSATSLEQLSNPWLVNNNFSADEVIEKFDDYLARKTNFKEQFSQGMSKDKARAEANSFVEANPYVIEVYLTIIEEVANSIKTGFTLDGLQRSIEDYIVKSYRQTGVPIPGILDLRVGQVFGVNDGRNIIEHLRGQVIPHYLINRLEQLSAEDACTDCNISVIGDSFSEASIVTTSSGILYDGSCPTSAVQSLPNLESSAELEALARVYNYKKPVNVLAKKGKFEVIAIGACPVCKYECGTGIKNSGSGRWYCTQKKCKEFDEEIFNYVFNITTKKEKPNIGNTKSNKQNEKNNMHISNSRHLITSLQHQIWRLEYKKQQVLYKGVDYQKLSDELIQKQTELKDCLN